MIKYVRSGFLGSGFSVQVLASRVEGMGVEV
jgi:hypothetical protein